MNKTNEIGIDWEERKWDVAKAIYIEHHNGLQTNPTECAQDAIAYAEIFMYEYQKRLNDETK